MHKVRNNKHTKNCNMTKDIITIGSIEGIHVMTFNNFFDPFWVQTQCNDSNGNIGSISFLNRENEQEIKELTGIVGVWHVKPKRFAGIE